MGAAAGRPLKLGPFGGSHWLLEACGRCPGGSPTSASAGGGRRRVLPAWPAMPLPPLPHLHAGPIRSAPAAPSASPEHVFTGLRMALLRGRHKTGWASLACPLGGGMRAQPPPPSGHEVSLQGGRALRGSKGKQRKIRDVPGHEGLQRVLRSAASLFLCLCQPRGRPWSSAQPRPL